MGYVKRLLDEKCDLDDMQYYFEWLCEKVDLFDPDHPKKIIAKMLWETEFYDLLSMDYNRILDARNLRMVYCPELSPVVRDSTVSVLEVLIAFSYRIENDLFGRNFDEANPSKWFYEMVENMFGMDICLLEDMSIYRAIVVDDNLTIHDFLHKRIEKVLERTYEYTGKGGLFPLKKCAKDQRMEDLWYQMQAYMQQFHRDELLNKKE